MAEIFLPKDTRVLMGLEATRNSDTGITKAWVIPLAAEFGPTPTQEPQELPVGMGDHLPAAIILGLPQFTGGVPIYLDGKFVGVVLRGIWSGYSKVGAGGYFWHQFYEDDAYGARPASTWMQSDFLSGSSSHRRGKSVLLQSVDWRGDAAGGAQYTVNALGNGNVATDDILTVNTLTATKFGFGGWSYFYGALEYEVDGTVHVLDGTLAFSCQENRPTARLDGPFSQTGIAVDMAVGALTLSGELGLPMRSGGTGPTANLNFLSDAENHRVVTLDVLQANGPLETCTEYLRKQMKVYVFPMAPKPAPGNEAQAKGIQYTQRWQTARMENAADMKWPAEYHGPVRGPFNITATNKVFGVKADGGSTISVTLTEGSARSVDQVVTDLNDDATFAASLIADNWHGWLRLRTIAKGSDKSVQIDTAVSNSAHALFGFTNVTRTGKTDCVAFETLFNSISDDYEA
jgi:hypothetical protein